MVRESYALTASLELVGQCEYEARAEGPGAGQRSLLCFFKGVHGRTVDLKVFSQGWGGTKKRPAQKKEIN